MPLPLLPIGCRNMAKSTKKTRKRAFLDEMERVVPWQALMALIVEQS